MVPSGRACSRDPLGWPSSPAPAGTPLTTLTHTSACPPKAGNARKHHRGTDDVRQTRCTPTRSVPRRALRVRSLGAFPQRAQEVVVINTPVSRMRKPRHRQRLLGRSQVESRGGRIRTQVVRPRVCSQPRWVGLHPPPIFPEWSPTVRCAGMSSMLPYPCTCPTVSLAPHTALSGPLESHGCSSHGSQP